MTGHELNDANHLTRELTECQTFHDLMDTIRGDRKLIFVPLNARSMLLSDFVKRCGGRLFYTVEIKELNR